MKLIEDRLYIFLATKCTFFDLFDKTYFVWKYQGLSPYPKAPTFVYFIILRRGPQQLSSIQAPAVRRSNARGTMDKKNLELPLENLSPFPLLGAGAHTHLFSFCPEAGSPMESHSSPSLSQYRRIKLARWIINESLGSANRIKFDKRGRLVDFGIDIKPLIQMGEPFMTSGCLGRDGKVACNRPSRNERPAGPIRNFPFPLLSINFLHCLLHLCFRGSNLIP